MIHRAKLFTTIALTIISVFVLSACSEAKSDIKVTEKIVTIPVTAEPVTVAAIDATYGTTTSLEAAAEADVVAKVSGVVTEILVEEGDYVVAGQVLAQLEVEKLTLELNQASANLNQLANDLRRHEKLYQKNLVSLEAYDRIRFQYEAQKAVTDLAKLNLDFATIRSPIAGVIAIRYIKSGNLLMQNAPAFHITDLSELHAIIHLPESEKAVLAVGQLANIMVDAAEYPFQGSIQRISPIVDSDSGTIKVTVSLKDKTAILRPGMFGRVGIVYDTHEQTVLVPKDTVLTEDDEISVFIVKENIAYKQSVSIGFSNADYIEIIAGIEVGDMVVTRGQRNLKNESNVELIAAMVKL